MGLGRKSKSYDDRRREAINLISKYAYSVGNDLQVNIDITNSSDKNATKITITMTQSAAEGFE